MRRNLIAALTLGVLVSAQPARADLIDLGNGMIYDTVQDLTWMQDTWYSRADGADPCFNGQPGCFATQEGAAAWVANLNFGGYDDWRLPARIPGQPAAFCPQFACPEGYSEISVMLQSLGWHWEYGNSSRPYYAAGNTGPFVNFQPTYWLGAPSYWWSSSEDVFLAEPYGTRAWAVRNGVTRVPEPSALVLVALGLAGALARRRRGSRVRAETER